MTYDDYYAIGKLWDSGESDEFRIQIRKLTKLQLLEFLSVFAGFFLKAGFDYGRAIGITHKYLLTGREPYSIKIHDSSRDLR
jgi:hypothetical protein